MIVERGSHYTILPMLPELRQEATSVSALLREFSSADAVLDMPATVALLERHRLMPDLQLASDEELLR